MAAELAVHESDFKTRVLESDKPVMVDFWATWCPPCLRIAPHIEEMANKYKEKGLILKVDVDENRTLAQEYGIMSIPALIIFKDGREVDRMVGAGSPDDLNRFFEKHLS